MLNNIQLHSTWDYKSRVLYASVCEGWQGRGEGTDLKKRSALHLGGMAWIPKRNDGKNAVEKIKCIAKKLLYIFILVHTNVKEH